jgi:hypothetical protein
MRRLFAGLLGSLLLAVITQAQQVSPTEFIVLRTERVDVPVGETTHLNCSVVGSGDAAQISCESQTSGCGSETSGSGPYGSSPCRLGTGLGRGLGTRVSVYHVALVVGSNHVGYVVYCGGGGLLRIGCQPLSTGQVLKGSVKGDRLSVLLGTKTKTYTVETSAYIGPLTHPSQNESTASPTPQPGTEPSPEPSPEPTVKLAVEKSGNPASPPSSSQGRADPAQAAAPQTARADLASVMSPISVSGNAFLAHCETEEDKITREACKLWVDGFLNGLVAGMAAATPGEAEFDAQKNNVVCFTETATYGQVFPLILKYIRDHPAEREDPTAVLAFSALQDAFPCKPIHRLGSGEQ